MNDDRNEPQDDGTYGAETFASSERELSAVDNDFSSFLRQRLVFWVIRWTIGFALTWAIVTAWPDLSWLWWVAGFAALLSLASMLILQFVIKRKIRETARRIADAKTAVAEFDRDAG